MLLKKYIVKENNRKIMKAYPVNISTCDKRCFKVVDPTLKMKQNPTLDFSKLHNVDTTSKQRCTTLHNIDKTLSQHCFDIASTLLELYRNQ